MDALFGIKTQKETILVTSRNFARGITIMNHQDKKYIMLTDKIAMGIVGEAGDTAHFAAYIKANVKLYENSFAQLPTISFKDGEVVSDAEENKKEEAVLSTKNIANFVRLELAKSLRSRKPYNVNLIIAGADGDLYMIDYLGTMVKQPYVVQGYAAFYAMALLDHHYRTNLSEEEGVELAKMCLKEINLRMPASVGDVDIVILSNDKPPKQFIIADKDLRKTI